MVTIKKTALEKAIAESVDTAKLSPGFFCEDRFAIYCEKDLQVQVVITTDADDFCDDVLKDYADAVE